jgi:hypothetical protein
MGKKEIRSEGFAFSQQIENFLAAASAQNQ